MGLYDLTFYDIIVQNDRLIGPAEAWRLSLIHISEPTRPKR